MNIAVLGSGYVGLVTAAVFAELGNRVIGVDINVIRIEQLSQGQSPIFEPGLEEMLHRNIAAHRLSFTTDTDAAVHECEIVFIAVGTPPAPDGSTDLSQVESAAKAIAQAAPTHRTVVNKSTVPVGTGVFVDQLLRENSAPNVTFAVLSNPEFLREGTALEDAMHPDRIIIGATSREAAQILIDLYQPLDCPVLCTDVPSAEMIKYASNAFLATKISFINDIADICEQVGADIRNVAQGMGFDNRIGKKFLHAGIGFGGSCFPKDVESLISVARELGTPSTLLEAVRQVNTTRVPKFIERIQNIAGCLQGQTVAVLGLTFKPNTDDLRESKPLDICQQLHDAGAIIRVHDPIAMANASRQLPPDVTFCQNATEAATNADIIILATEWNEYTQLNLLELRQVMRGNILADGRNLYSAERAEAAGFRYLGIGRSSQYTPLS